MQREGIRVRRRHRLVRGAMLLALVVLVLCLSASAYIANSLGRRVRRALLDRLFVPKSWSI